MTSSVQGENIEEYIEILNENNGVSTLATSGDATYNIYGEQAFTEEYSVGAFVPSLEVESSFSSGFIVGTNSGEGVKGDYIYVASNTEKSEDFYRDSYDAFAMGHDTYDVRVYFWLIEGDDYAISYRYWRRFK